MSNGHVDTLHLTNVEICNDTNSDNVTQLSEAMTRMETTCTNFKKLYAHDLKGWVDRTPEVETNADLEHTTKELSQVLSNIHETSEAISIIRSSCNGIASKSRELDEYLIQNK